MKVLLHYPDWGNRWIPYFEKELSSRYDLTVNKNIEFDRVSLMQFDQQSMEADVLISMWCNNITAYWTDKFPRKKIISYLRRFEMWEPKMISGINFAALDALIFVSDYYAHMIQHMYEVNSFTCPDLQTYVIPNSVDFSDFPYRKREPGKNIAMVCQLKDVKNMPLAFQILRTLPEQYKIHHIGLPYDDQINGQLTSYYENLGLHDRFIPYGSIPREQVPKWLEDKDYILSTSLNEGNPNNVIEAMAMGIKPIIHNWPGALDQFPADLVWSDMHEAIRMILDQNDYDSARYREIVERQYSLNNIKRIHEVISNL